MAKKWIQGAIKRPGAFTRKAEAAGMSVAAFRGRVLANPGRYDTRTVRQANLAKTLSKLDEGGVVTQPAPPPFSPQPSGYDAIKEVLD